MLSVIQVYLYRISIQLYTYMQFLVQFALVFNAFKNKHIEQKYIKYIT